MSRYTGPRVRAARALGTELPGLTRKSHERRPYRPGQHGQARKRLSEYATRLLEKQKLRMNYGLSERQMLGLMLQASSGKGNTGQELLVLLERRLDNAVFRAGFARTIPAARQLVNHGHVLVNDHRVDVPSYRIRQGDVIRLRERSKQHPHVAAALATPLPFPTEWLSVDAGERKATVTSLPDASSVPFPVNVQRVVEFYSQRT